MEPPSTVLLQLVREARTLVRDARHRRPLTEAWTALEERDGDGILRGVWPYNDRAFSCLYDGLHQDTGDLRIVHHLAIAHHARAWDLELAGQEEAVREWELALRHWRTLASSRDFWQELELKLLPLEAAVVSAGVARMRRELYERLLEIHVDFIRHYCETGAPQRAIAHVGIVRRAQIPAPIKNRLTTRLFEGMTGAIPEAMQAGEFTGALTMIDRFLAIFPDHLPALRLHAEVVATWVRTLSFQTRWPEIVDLAGRAHPVVLRLSAHPELENEPLAWMALEDSATEIAQRGKDRLDSLGPREAPDAPLAACELGLAWAGLAYPRAGAEAQVRFLFAYCAFERAKLLAAESSDALDAELDRRMQVRAAIDPMERAIRLLDEAISAYPKETALFTRRRDDLRNNLQELRDELLFL